MKILLLLFLLSSSNCSTTPATTVYICDSSAGKRYHLSENCRGLRNCQHRIVQLTLEQAKKRGKTLCGWEK